MYVVFQDGKRCKEYQIKGWENDEFDSKEEAEVFALMWAYPFTQEESEVNRVDMGLGIEYDFSMSVEFPIKMKIELI